MESAREELPGYWPPVGGYTKDGTIQRRRDHPLDLEGNREMRRMSGLASPGKLCWSEPVAKSYSAGDPYSIVQFVVRDPAGYLEESTKGITHIE